MINLQGILFDKKSSFLQGPAEAPPLIREYLYSESSNSYAENGRSFEDISWKDLGDFNPNDYFQIEEITQDNIRDGSKLISLGGDHSISYPIVKAMNEVHGSFDILHLDAHSDLYDEFEGDKYSHACPFARIMEGGHARRLVQLGIRTLNPHQREQIAKYDVQVIEMKDYSLQSVPKFDQPLYLSIDMDALDPSYAPGVSHYEPGGFTSRQVIDIINSLDCEIIGADIVEYNPSRDLNGMTGMLAAKFLKEVIARM